MADGKRARPASCRSVFRGMRQHAHERPLSKEINRGQPPRNLRKFRELESPASDVSELQSKQADRPSYLTAAGHWQCCHRPASGSKVDSHWQCGCATNRARPAWGICCWQARLRSHTCQYSRPHPPATAASQPLWDTAIRQAHVARWAERIGRDKQTNQPLLAVLPRGVREDTGGGQ
jgi:hypothetical protein